MDDMIDLLDLNSIKALGVAPLNYILERKLVPQHGLWLEFGVYKGSTIKLISKYKSKGVVHGFDSFEGLPEDWDREHKGDWSHKGAFSMGGRLPEVPDNIILHKGLFDITLPKFLESTSDKISFVHIDCDLYSSTKFVLEHIKKRLGSICYIVFDEIINYPGWERNEAKALFEFINTNGDEWDWNWIGGFSRFFANHIGNNSAAQEAVLVLRRKEIKINYKVAFGSFYTENYCVPNAHLISTYHTYSSVSTKIENRLLSENEYCKDGVRAFQRGNTIKWRLLIELVESHKETGVVIIYTDSDAEFTGDISQVIETFMCADVDIMFQTQNEGVNEKYLPSAIKRWKADVNIGFIICHASDLVLDYLRHILNICDANRSGNLADNPSQDVKTTGWDQMVINEDLVKGTTSLRWKLLPLELVGKKGKVFAHHYAEKKAAFMARLGF